MLIMAAGTAIVLGGPGDASASCAKPEIAVTPTQAFPGSDVTIQGKDFSSTCGGTTTNAPTMPVAIVFIQDHHRTPLRRVDVDRRGGFSVSVVVPDAAHPGSAQFTAAPPAEVPSRPFTVVALPNGLTSTRSDTAIRLALAALTLLAGAILFIGGYLLLDRTREEGNAAHGRP
jgi:hypothetical protein